VAAVLGDAEHRVSVLGGREGMPRSLGSVYGGSVTRFLGGSLRGVESRIIATCRTPSPCNGVAVRRDGRSVLVTDTYGPERLREICVADGALLHSICARGDEQLQFSGPSHMCVDDDGFVHVADFGNHHVQVLTPRLDFHRYVGKGQLSSPVGVCTNADVVVVSDNGKHCLWVFNLGDGAFVRRIGREGSARGELCGPRGLCLLSDRRHVAVAEQYNNRVSVFSVDGEFIRHVGEGVLRQPCGVACSPHDELVVADYGNARLRVFSAAGDLLATVGTKRYSCVALLDATVFAAGSGTCTVLE
jgi:DNA-binding beta-propeller fold protein YncE